MEAVTDIAIIIVVSLLYFIPTIIAVASESKYAAPAILVNVFAGWTFLGWIMAIVFASIQKEQRGDK